MAGVCAHRGDAERVAGEAGRVGDAGQDVEVAPEMAGGVGEGGGEGKYYRRYSGYWSSESNSFQHPQSPKG
jgi:hypothetical protein